MNPNLHIPMFLTFLITLLLFQLLNLTNASPSPPITAVYAFGDSTVDSGNNNYIPTLFQSNHPPYGKSFPAKLSTGRFSDGKLATDFIVSSLGLKPTLPAYLNPSVKPVDLLTGVSFASAGGGLDDRTAKSSLTLTMDKQWSYFEEALGKMKSLVGDSETNRVIKNAVIVISAGTNDMIFNVYDHVLGSLISVSDYQDSLLTKVEVFVQRLYDAGARRITIAGLPPIGCLPVQVTLASVKTPRIFHHRICTENQNDDSRVYNKKLQKLIFRLSQRLRGSKVLYLDIYSPLIDMIKHPRKYGLEETLRGCCGTGLLEAGPLCQPLSRTCDDVSKYLFFDSVHPSQKAYSVIASFALQNLFPLL
ncbi:GDSL-motif lipase/hydrolase family protein [Arabidopsis lyrata subsp. lyrata]|uniref:GDSL-motif lipase/hydrolase family protein n=1 Tax=Arabidopsis lyrata subsp. lyrata TaxID=81972 RepID=D7LEH6_ARALL|nr:GDSL esterase/lipase At2g40250 [Arabidopsis lyrata subsp. lyrata]EFH56116.1 GDSL-motif lipase/hydrolase family protein [Arabidopsis lyrata subsp. lyrata]|eukprot:XP_002879857.1 GDSL esterase/lipase At2g40250 [Arabidopsis lyrata subsp. lyrata]